MNTIIKKEACETPIFTQTVKYENKDYSEVEIRDNLLYTSKYKFPLNGRGNLKFCNGSFFEGEWKYCRMWNGQGNLAYPNGNTFEGEWKYGQLWNGQGILIYTNGDSFEGEWKNGQKWNGRGKITHPYDIFEGDWQNGRMWNGRYVLKCADGNIVDYWMVNCGMIEVY